MTIIVGWLAWAGLTLALLAVIFVAGRLLDRLGIR